MRTNNSGLKLTGLNKEDVQYYNDRRNNQHNYHDHDMTEAGTFNDNHYGISQRGSGSNSRTCSSVLGNTHEIIIRSEGSNLMEEFKFNSISHPRRLTIGNDTNSSDIHPSGTNQLEHQPIDISTTTNIFSRDCM